MASTCWGRVALVSIGLCAAPAAADTAAPAAETASAPASHVDDCGLLDPAALVDAPPVPQKENEMTTAVEVPAVWRVRTEAVSFAGAQGAVGGALSGKTVYLSPGHGWSYVQGIGWRTQRGNTNGVIEDFVSAETAAYYLLRHLRNMGAYVVPLRELDPNPNQSIVDDAGEGFSVDEALSLSPVDVGYGIVSTPITGSTNPFRSGASQMMTAAAEATGAAVWTFDVPETGAYNVYIGYEQDPSRAADAHYVVRHAGGETHFRVDQRRHGQTWMLLGRFWFEAGVSPELGSVALFDDSATPGATISADVARIGGGMNVMDRGGGVGEFPMFEVCARYYTQLAGAPASVYNASDLGDASDDVGTRSRFAAWEHEAGEDAVYIAWHTNAPNPGTGTSTYTYSRNAPPAPQSAFKGVAGSLELQNAVHAEIVGDLRAVWDADWYDRGRHTAFFGEVNPDLNPEMPAMLAEIAFHDTPGDAAQLREPRFRYIASRAYAQGVARYFADKDGTPLTLPPEPPSAPHFVQDGGKLVLRWAPPALDAAGGDPATSYRVYLSRDGYGFDNGQEASGTELILDETSAEAVYARITSVNDGGESFPSRVVGARLAAADVAQVLVVDGYTRLDAGQLLTTNYSAYDLGVVNRALIELINDGSYVARYGAALDAAGVSFHTADADAVGAGDVALDDYRAVVWLAGEESAGDAPMDESERDAVSAYMAGGGKLLFSGSELVWAFSEVGTDAERAFVNEVLRVTYVADDAETFSIAPSAGGLFDGMADFSFDDDGFGGYAVEYPDVLAPGPGAIEALAYGGGVGGGAAIWWNDDDSGAAALVMGFSLETVAGAEIRAELVAKAMAGFGLEPDPYGDGDGDGDGNGDGDGDGDGDGVPGDLLTGGCGCQSGGAGGGPLVVVLLALAIAHRRRRTATARLPG